MFLCGIKSYRQQAVKFDFTAGNFYLDVRCQKQPFLRVTDGIKRCNKQISDLILKWRCNTKLVLNMTSLAGLGRKDGALGGYKVKKRVLKQ